MLNPLFDEAQLVDRINETDATLLIVANELYGRVENVIPKTAIKTVITCPAVNSLGAVVKAIKKVKSILVGWQDYKTKYQSPGESPGDQIFRGAFYPVRFPIPRLYNGFSQRYVTAVPTRMAAAKQRRV